MNTSERFAFLVLYAAAALLYVDPHALGASTESPLWTFLSCHFSHAGLLHLSLNALGFYLLTAQMPVRYTLVAFLSAVIALPFSLSATPTVGLSGVVYAQAAIIASREWRNLVKVGLLLVPVNLVALLLGPFNVTFHALSFVIGALLINFFRLIHNLIQKLAERWIIALLRK
jgi:membrane associated rhomboid family serine protease